MQYNNKYTPQVVDKIKKYLREGNMREDSAVMSGISRETYDIWFKKYPEFKVAVEEAEGRNKNRTLKLLQKHGKKSWQALAWWLERRFYSDYMSKTSTKIEGTGGVQIAIVSGGYIPPIEPKQPIQGITDGRSLELSDKSDSNERE